MKASKDDFLYALERVMPALRSKGDFEQSGCLLFRDGFVHAYDKKIYCRAPVKVPVDGAVDAKVLLRYLQKLSVDELQLTHDEGFLVFRHGRANKDCLKMRLQAQVTLPVEDVDEPEEWGELPETFSDALAIVQECAGKDREKYYTVCVHVHPRWLEAIASVAGPACRYQMRTGVKKSCMVERDVLKAVVASGVNEIGETDSWLHFRADDFRISCRREVDEFIDLDEFGLFVKKGKSPIVLPASLADIAQLGEIISSENKDENFLTVEIREGEMEISAVGSSAQSTHVRDCKYKGPPLRFRASPALIKSISEKSDEAWIGDGKLLVDGGNWRFVAALRVPDEEED